MIFLSSPFKEALYFSAQVHDGQYRKGGNVPYLVHPVLVAVVVSEYTHNEDALAAALLHDVMEDCGVEEITLQEKFGAVVASLVREVSYLEEGSPTQSGSWMEKKKAYLNKMETLSENALTIIACDKMVNMKSYFEALKTNPEKVRTLFSGSPEDYSWYYEQVGSILKKRHTNSSLVDDYLTLFGEKQKALQF